MTERTRSVQAPWRGRHNYTLNSGTVLRDAYRLLCVIMADRAIAEIIVDEADSLISLREQFVEDEILHTVIQLAVMNRTQIDHMNGPRSDPSELSFRPVERDCGVLTEDVRAEGNEFALSFREACNKIIHAEHIVAETDETSGWAFPALPQTLVLRGTKNRSAWQAHLNVPEFLRGTVENFDPFR